MKNSMVVMTATVLVIFLSACNEEIVNTVEYYQNNKEERAAKIEECRKTGAKNDAGYTANCQNASKAERISDINKPFINPFK